MDSITEDVHVSEGMRVLLGSRYVAMPPLKESFYNERHDDAKENRQGNLNPKAAFFCFGLPKNLWCSWEQDYSKFQRKSGLMTVRMGLVT